MELNIFKSRFNWKWYVRHPLQLFKDIKLTIKSIYWRATKGYCYADLWNWCDWFLAIVPIQLRELAQKGEGYPGNDQFPTPESWYNHLISIANLLENAQENARNKKNEWYPDYEKALFSKEEHRELSEKYYKRDKELYEEQIVMVEEALKLLAETPIYAIWD